MPTPDPDDAPGLELRGLTRRFGSLVAVDGLDLEVRRGEVFGFLGPNGAGKTTTIRMATGLLRPSAGEVRVLGHDMVRDPLAAKRRIGLVPDTPPLYDHLTGREYAAFVASLWEIEPATRDREIARLFELFELADAADELCKGYSFGTRKKLHVAAVLATLPRVLFLDEPTIGLDPRSARRLKDHLAELRRDGVTVFLTTHLLDLAQSVCDRVAILVSGRLRALGTPAELQKLRGAADLEAVFLQLTEESAADATPAAR